MIVKISDIFNKDDNNNTNTAKPIFSEQEWAEIKCKSFNDIEGDLNLGDGIDCPICKNKGLVMRIVEGDYGLEEKVYPCKCKKRRKLAKLAINSGLGDYLKKTSKDFQHEQDWQEDMFVKMVDFCTNESNTNSWFIACGQSGCGKTLLCSIIANNLLNNHDRAVLYITWTDFISKLKRDMMSFETDMVSSYFEQVKTVDVLFIDELLKKYNETDLKYIIEIINYRYTNDLKTIITSERLIDELLDIDEATFGRVLEKSGRYIINIAKDRKKNYRLKDLNF